MCSEIDTLSESLIDELVTAVGLPKTRFYHALFWHLFRRITDPLARIGVPFNQITRDEGLPAAASWCLDQFCSDIRVVGKEHVPATGPLMVMSNHPGAYDGLVLFSEIDRKDMNWVSSEIPFLDALPNLREHIFFSSRKDSIARMLVMRNSVKHLLRGGAMVYFAGGHRDPDPAVYTGAEDAMDQWLDVYDAFFKYVPGLQVLPTVISGIVSPRWARHPLTWLRRKPIDKHRLAEFGQVITQLLHPGRIMLSPVMTIGKAFGEQEIRAEAGGGKVLDAVIARGKGLLQAHIGEFGGMF